jgi:hypothetical protein
MSVLPELLLAPILVAISILACRRWGQRVGGLVSSFPAVVGPVLLIAAREHGASFAARSANATLLGLATLAAFTVGYAKTAGRLHWSISLASGWVAAAALAVPLRLWAGHLDFPAGLLVAILSLSAAYAVLPAGPSRFEPEPPDSGGGQEVMLQMALTTGLVGGLSIAGAQLGPTVGGMLAALPVLASVLAIRTHRRYGPPGVLHLLRGMLTGMPAFVGFCALVELLIVSLGTAVAFSLAIALAVSFQLMALDRRAMLRLDRETVAGR